VEYCPDRHIALALLDLVDIRTAQAYLGGEFLLGETPLLPVLTDGSAQELQGRIRARRPFSHGVSVVEEVVQRETVQCREDQQHQNANRGVLPLKRS